MSQKNSPPSVQEMGERILNNLSRVQGYLEILKEEIEQPEKLGPGTSKPDWQQAAKALSDSLDDLETFLKAKNWENES